MHPPLSSPPNQPQTTKLPLSPSIVRKITNTFSSKQHSHIKQEIELDEPFKIFNPGDSIKGSISLEVSKPTRVTHLVVRLHGFVKVISHSKLPGEPIPYDENLLNNSRGRQGKEYFGNGFARLFEDEHVLCGDGRLLGQYRFRFEVLLPRRGIPSSIDFENGTITYLLSSTLTKATTIAPTVNKYKKLSVRESIDIGLVPVPKPQVASIDAMRKRRPVIHMKRKFSSPQEKETSPIDGEERRERSLRRPSIISDAPDSPIPSEVSSVSMASSAASRPQSSRIAQQASESKVHTSSTTSMTSIDRTITAQTEVLCGGCLPGDVLPIRISVDHIKPIKSMQGVIITFYRLAHIDVAPAIPLGPADGNRKAKFEDYYPKSRTGLGGLSLSYAGSSRSFRQDLSQNIAPLVVDPHSLTATLKTSVQVPDHVFPTINGVPGSMISFKYFVEVVIDLRGKFGQDKLLHKFDMIDISQHAYGDPEVSMKDSHDGVTITTTPGFNLLVTDHIRRQKGVVHTQTEVIVGTSDSTRIRGKEPSNGAIDHQPHVNWSMHDKGSGYFWHELDQIDPHDPQTTSPNGYEYTPPHPPEEPLDEKQRIRRAEQTLLPSAPPASDSPEYDHVEPSAPQARNNSDFLDRYQLQPAAPAYIASSSPPLHNATHATQDSREPGASSSDDKQELERQRLQAMASSPGYDAPTEPSAPSDPAIVLPNGDSGSQNHASGSSAAAPDAPVVSAEADDDAATSPKAIATHPETANEELQEAETSEILRRTPVKQSTSAEQEQEQGLGESRSNADDTLPTYHN